MNVAKIAGVAAALQAMDGASEPPEPRCENGESAAAIHVTGQEAEQRQDWNTVGSWWRASAILLHQSLRQVRLGLKSASVVIVNLLCGRRRKTTSFRRVRVWQCTSQVMRVIRWGVRKAASLVGSKATVEGGAGSNASGLCEAAAVNIQVRIPSMWRSTQKAGYGVT